MVQVELAEVVVEGLAKVEATSGDAVAAAKAKTAECNAALKAAVKRVATGIRHLDGARKLALHLLARRGAVALQLREVEDRAGGVHRPGGQLSDGHASHPREDKLDAGRQGLLRLR